MRAKYLFPLMALSATLATAGERESFDFDWKFKYFGGYDPALAGSAATANSHQGGHPASHAVDNDMNTRWCAPNQSKGHKLTVRPNFNDPVQLFFIYGSGITFYCGLHIGQIKVLPDVLHSLGNIRRRQRRWRAASEKNRIELPVPVLTAAQLYLPPKGGKIFLCHTLFGKRDKVAVIALFYAERDMKVYSCHTNLYAARS